MPATANATLTSSILTEVGASLPLRDASDKRSVDNVKNRTGKLFNGIGYGTPNPVWPVL